MEKTLEKKVGTVQEWATKYNQHLVTEVVNDLVARITELETQSPPKNPVTDTALKTLSYSEIRAAQSIFCQIPADQNEALVVASKVADAIGITRSVIVNALSKLEAGGMITSRSLGMKGTMIRILVPSVRVAVSKLSS